MKTLLYPKTYARLIKIIDRDNLGRRTNLFNHVYIYEVVDKDTFSPVTPKQTIEQRYPGSSGHTPRRAEKVTHVEKVGRKKYTSWGYKMVGEIFKLYQRPQDNGRWSYRWLGQ